MDSIGDAWGFSSKTPITPSRGFSIKILTGVSLSWKTKLNRSISTIEDRIPGELQHHHKTCCEKYGCHWKAGLYDLEIISLQGCNFQMGELAYNTFTTSEELFELTVF